MQRCRIKVRSKTNNGYSDSTLRDREPSGIGTKSPALRVVPGGM
ncbi:hypothetical protein POKO110462_00675 [Pontibacter korlensis]|nr:hypothetical protein [Pontibacter korlensis]